MTKEHPLDEHTLPGRHRLPDDVDPATTDRWWAPTEHMVSVTGDGFDRFIPPTEGRHAAKEAAMPEDEARQLVANVAARVPVPEQDTDTGWSRLAGLLGVDAAAVA